ncbi:MAG: SusC/RagA family TonB-linked outer membrane protein [Sphingobacteriales bacterium]|nr:SusC/RagA family TonB-linked outer membrane protein [Sphingobacteriales bacterium]
MTLKRFMQLAALPLLVILISCRGLYAQDKIVTGKVTDSKDGSPVIGASIVPKGSKTGTTTSSDGTFRIKMPSGITVIVVTSVGFAKQEIDVASSSQINISLIATGGNLNEVVVIGYGTAKKKDLTGSVVAISSKDFVKGIITTPEQLIIGKVAGVQITSNGGAPGAGSTIRIRGGASLNASNDPLIVIDGVPLDNGGISGSANALALINPNDIESFNILKDASAAAIYGSRASNGVIIITTKKGKKGKPVFNFSTQVSMSQISKKVDVLSADEVRAFVNANGTTAQKQLLGSANTDWQDKIYRTAYSQDNNLSVSGSLKNMPYRASIGFLNQDGILKNGNVKRYSAGFNIGPRLFNNHLKIDLNVKGAMNKNKFANEGAIGSAVTFDPTQEVYSKSTRFGGYYEWLDPNSVSGLRSLAPRNPLGILLQRDDRSTVYRSIGNLQLDYKLHFLPDLRANLNLGYDILQGEGTVYVSDSSASSYQRGVDETGKLSSGVNNKYKQKKQNTLLEFYLNYVKDIKPISSRIDFMAGYSYQDFLTTNYNYADYFANGAKRKNSDPIFATDEFRNRLISFYGRLNYGFKNRYLLTFTLRRDGSSRFSKDNRWGTFPSIATSWKIKDESFLRDFKPLSDLRLRLGYGVTGQQDGIGLYDYISYYSLSNLSAQYQFGSNFYQLYRPGGYYADRKWEQTETLNAALDYGFANNRISGSIEVYKKFTTRLLNLIAQPAGTNFSNTIVANVGNMENKGVEVTINTEPIKRKDLSWDLDFNFTYNENKITKLTISQDPTYPGNKYGGISGGVGNTILINSVGYNRGAFYVFKQVYDKNDKPVEGAFVDKNGDGIINNDDLYQYMGVDPRVLMGLSSSVTYKNFSIGFVMRASLDNYLYNNVASSTGTSRNILNPLNYINNGSADFLNSNFTGSGDKFFLSDYFIQNASFLRMDNINIGYNVGKVFNNKANLRIGANAQNVFVITKYKGVDPEIGGGIDNTFYPRPRVFVLTANIDF